MLSGPEPLAPHHRIAALYCAVSSLDEWLIRRAALIQSSGASRTFVTFEPNQVVGYHALGSSVVAPVAPGRFRRDMPDPIAVVVLARLHQSQGLGRALFQDAGRRVFYSAEANGILGLLVHALSEASKAFIWG